MVHARTTLGGYHRLRSESLQRSGPPGETVARAARIEKVRWSKVEGAKVESVMAVPLTVPIEAIADVAAAVDEVLARGVVPQAAVGK